LSTTAVNRGPLALSRVHSHRYQGRRENRHESDEEWDRLTFGGFLAANRSKIMAFENARNQAEEGKDAKALDGPRDNSLLYIDYDGTLKAKADFLASVKAAGHRPEQKVTESMNAHVYGNTAVGTGVCRVKGVDQGKLYQRRGRFTDAWIHQNGTWVFVASQYTLMSR
jgi:ketosteroid isomerase-like protein